MGELGVRAAFGGGRLWAWAIVIFSMIVLIDNAWPQADYYPVDFRSFWLAGRIWLEGGNPYSAELMKLGEQTFPDAQIFPFFYPPHWRAPASLIALTDPHTAKTFWAFASVSTIIAAAWLTASIAMAQEIASRFIAFAVILLVYAYAFHASDVALLIGQPMAFILLGAAALLYSAQRHNQTIAALALCLLLFKPQLSIPILGLAIFTPFLRIPAVMACAITAVFALFGLAVADPLAVFQGFFENASLYPTFEQNKAIYTSGPNYIFALLGLSAISPFLWLAIVCCLIAGLCSLPTVHAALKTDAQTQLTALMLTMAAAAFFMPTHNGDFLFIAPAVILVLRLTGIQRILFVSGFFLIMRSLSLSNLTGAYPFADKTAWVGAFDTIGSLAILTMIALSLSSAFMHTKDIPFSLSGMRNWSFANDRRLKRYPETKRRAGGHPH